MLNKTQTIPPDPEALSIKSSVNITTIEHNGVRRGVYISAIVAAIGGFLCGFDTGATSGVLTRVSFQELFFTKDNLEYLQGLLLALFLMTAALGAFFSGYFCGTDKFLLFYMQLFFFFNE